MSIIIVYFAYLILGAFAGILSGLLGIGGGVITVPCFLLLLPFADIPQGYLMHVAVATSLAAMIFSTVSSTLSHHKRGSILWDIFRKFLPGLIFGSIIGSLVAVWLNDVILEIVFGIFLLLLAVRFYFQKPIQSEAHRLPSRLILSLFATGIGAISNLLGIGGGSMTVPLLTSFNVRDKNAIGTSAATTLVTTFCGTIAYLILGSGDIEGSGTFGLINIPAALIVGVIAFLTAPYGVKLTHEIDPAKVRKIFALVLAITGLSLII